MSSARLEPTGQLVGNSLTTRPKSKWLITFGCSTGTGAARKSPLMWSDDELQLQDDRPSEHRHHIGVLSSNSSEGGDGCDLDSSVPSGHMYETKPLTLAASSSQMNITDHHLGLGQQVNDHQNKMERTSSPRRPPLSSNSSMDNMRATLNLSPQGRSSSFG
ncbi:hypothetical protein Tco_0934275 [Tanacetum coccineum]